MLQWNANAIHPRKKFRQQKLVLIDKTKMTQSSMDKEGVRFRKSFGKGVYMIKCCTKFLKN